MWHLWLKSSVNQTAAHKKIIIIYEYILFVGAFLGFFSIPPVRFPFLRLCCSPLHLSLVFVVFYLSPFQSWPFLPLKPNCSKNKKTKGTKSLTHYKPCLFSGSRGVVYKAFRRFDKKVYHSNNGIKGTSIQIEHSLGIQFDFVFYWKLASIYGAVFVFVACKHSILHFDELKGEAGKNAIHWWSKEFSVVLFGGPT